MTTDRTPCPEVARALLAGRTPMLHYDSQGRSCRSCLNQFWVTQRFRRTRQH